MTYQTSCEDCGKELEGKSNNVTINNRIIVDFINGMEFYCDDCYVINHIEIRKYTLDI